jgi:hypothetical protein
MAAQDIYDFEVVIPRAVKIVLEGLDLKCYTIEDVIDFQKIRPRVEIFYRHMGETSPQRIAILPDQSKRTSCFRGELKIHAITDADANGKLAHSTYRAMVRNGIAALRESINGVHLLLHKIQFVQIGNEETGIRSADNLQQTTFPFHLDVSIQQYAWNHL